MDLARPRRVHRSDTVGVGKKRFRWHADPAIGHPKRKEDFIANIFFELPPIESADNFSQNEPTACDMVAGFLARHPPMLQRGFTDLFDGLTPTEVLGNVVC